MDFTELTDADLDGAVAEALNEQTRRQTLAALPIGAIPASVTAMMTRYLEETGVTDGREWRQPTGAWDAYPAGWRVICPHGLHWRATITGTIDEPCVGRGWEQVESTAEGE